jgi:hypothetical protein
MPVREMFVRLLGVLGGLAVFASGVALASTGEPAHGAFGGLLRPPAGFLPSPRR